MANQLHVGTLDRTLAGAPKRTILQVLGWCLVIAVLAWSWRGAEMRPLLLIKDWGNMVKFARDFFPPDFREWKYYLVEMAVTIQVAIWGTLLAMIFAVPLRPPEHPRMSHRGGSTSPCAESWIRRVRSMK